MKVEITQKGVHDAEGQPIPVGEEISVEGNTMPAWLVGKAVEVKPRKAKTAVTNPAKGAVQRGVEPSAQERQQMLGEITVNDLADDDFSEDGVPDVRKINEHLPEGAAKFSASERDAIWPGIADFVRAGRDALANEG